MHQQIYFYHEKHAQALSKLKLARRRQSSHHLQLEYYDILHWPIAYQKHSSLARVPLSWKPY